MFKASSVERSFSQRATVLSAYYKGTNITIYQLIMSSGKIWNCLLLWCKLISFQNQLLISNPLQRTNLAAGSSSSEVTPFVNVGKQSEQVLHSGTVLKGNVLQQGMDKHQKVNMLLYSYQRKKMYRSLLVNCTYADDFSCGHFEFI